MPLEWKGSYELTPSDRSFSKSLTTTSLGLTFAFSLFVPHHHQQTSLRRTVSFSRDSPLGKRLLLHRHPLLFQQSHRGRDGMKATRPSDSSDRNSLPRLAQVLSSGNEEKHNQRFVLEFDRKAWAAWTISLFQQTTALSALCMATDCGCRTGEKGVKVRVVIHLQIIRATLSLSWSVIGAISKQLDASDVKDKECSTMAQR